MNEVNNEPKTTITASRKLERDKTRMERGEDIAYTINHAISCGVTDLAIQPYVGTWVIRRTDEVAGKLKLPKWLAKIFEHHDDGANKMSFLSNVGHYLQAEVYGDVGAVPLTILVQRFAPGFMNGIRNVLEPMVGNTFKEGAHKASITWGSRQGFMEGSAEQKAKENELYEYEMKHLPQAVMWNVFAWPSNVFLQRYVFKHNHSHGAHCEDHGHSHSHGSSNSLGAIAIGKTFGAFVSNTALLGWRAVSPDSAHKWDQWNSEHIITPTTKAIGGLFGVDNETSERMARRHAESEGKDWKQRATKQADIAPVQVAAAR